MKKRWLAVGTGLLAMSLGGFAQNAGGPGPHAWGDKDKDGKCDITGQPVGQNRGQGRGRMMNCGRRGRGNGWGRQAQVQAPAPQQEKK